MPKIRKITSRAPHFLAVAKRAGLSPAEKNVVAYAIEGLSNSEIGKKLRISPITVGTHLTQAYRKTGVGSRQELSWLMQRGKKTTKKKARKQTAIRRYSINKACKCGKPLSSKWKYCPMCGKKIR